MLQASSILKVCMQSCIMICSQNGGLISLNIMEWILLYLIDLSKINNLFSLVLIVLLNHYWLIMNFIIIITIINLLILMKIVFIMYFIYFIDY